MIEDMEMDVFAVQNRTSQREAAKQYLVPWATVQKIKDEAFSIDWLYLTWKGVKEVVGLNDDALVVNSSACSTDMELIDPVRVAKKSWQ